MGAMGTKRGHTVRPGSAGGGEATDRAVADAAVAAEAALAERLRQAGQRVTPQRAAILGALCPGEHLSADAVLARVEGRMPSMNRSTVYRVLELFRDIGLVSETDLGGGVRQFELLGERHHHLVCRHCGTILALDDALVRPLREAVRARYGFAATVDHLAIFGRCAACDDAAGIDANR